MENSGITMQITDTIVVGGDESETLKPISYVWNDLGTRTNFDEYTGVLRDSSRILISIQSAFRTGHFCGV